MSGSASCVVLWLGPEPHVAGHELRCGLAAPAEVWRRSLVPVGSVSALRPVGGQPLTDGTCWPPVAKAAEDPANLVTALTGDQSSAGSSQPPGPGRFLLKDWCPLRCIHSCHPPLPRAFFLDGHAFVFIFLNDFVCSAMYGGEGARS